MKTVKATQLLAKQQRLNWIDAKIEQYQDEANEIRAELKGLDVANLLREEIERTQKLLASLEK